MNDTILRLTQLLGLDKELLYKSSETFFREWEHCLLEVTKDYATLRKDSPFLIDNVLRTNGGVGIPMLLHYITKKRFQCFSKINWSLDVNIWEGWSDADIKLSDKLNIPKGAKLQLKDAQPSCVDTLSEDERIQLSRTILHTIQNLALHLSWEAKIIESVQIMLFILRCICIKEQNIDLFYHVYMMVIDRVATSAENQHCRNMAEEALIMGYVDNRLDVAYMIACRAYTAVCNIYGAIFFYSLALNEVSRHKTMNKRMGYELCWQLLKIFRLNGKYRTDDLKILVRDFQSISCSTYEKNSINLTLYSMRMGNYDQQLCSEIADYLSENLEIILKEGEHGIIPWMIALLNLQMNYPAKDFIQLESYLNLFDSAIPDKSGLQPQYDIVKGYNLRAHFIELSLRLHNTLYANDLSTDAYYAQIVAKKLVGSVTKCGQKESFLLAMTLRSDIGYAYNPNRVVHNVEPIELCRTRAEDVETVYESEDSFRQLMNVYPQDEVIWLGIDDKRKVRQLSMWKNTFALSDNETWIVNEVRTVGAKMIFSDYNSQKKEFKNLCDYDFEAKELLGSLATYSITTCDSERLLLIKDMELSAYPHQLMVDHDSKAFIGELKPTCNVLSSELLMKENAKEIKIPLDFSRSFWIPVDCTDGQQDTTILGVHAKLSELMNKYHVDMMTDLYPTNPLSSHMNIVCAHGAKTIRDEKCFYLNDTPIQSVNRIIGKGNILLLWICHSGTMDVNRYEESVHSLVKDYIVSGYSAVVAPMWSLPITILPIWFDAFMTDFLSGSQIIDSVYKANMAVKEIYSTPTAWGCLHLFGNPYLQVFDIKSC